MLFGHVILRKRMSPKQGARVISSEITVSKLCWYLGVPRAPARTTPHIERPSAPEDFAALGNTSAVWDAHPDAATGKGVQALGGHVPSAKLGLETRLGTSVKGSHPVTRWLVDHAADLLSK